MLTSISNFEERLGPEVVLIAAIARRMDGGFALLGMKDITGGMLRSEKRTMSEYLQAQPQAHVIEAEEITRLEAQGGEMFAMNYADLGQTFTALRELLENKQEA